jgi:glycosyltransferase involved in cell wall biosynthesis
MTVDLPGRAGMKLIGLVDSEDHVCCRYRLAAFRPSLAAAGHSLDLVPLPENPLSRLRLFCSLARYDAVILQRKLFARLSTALLRRYSRRLIFDLDDAVWLRDSYHPKGVDSEKRLRRFETVCQMGDLIVTGNEHLADFAERFARNRVVTIPTCVDPARYPTANHHSSKITLVWVGSSSTLAGLQRIRGTLESVGKAIPGLTLKIICDEPIEFDALKVVYVPWSEASEAAEIASSDIGIAWMPDDAWSRGKCGLKVLQYLAAGVPVVANRVGVHPAMVRDGVTGFLADSTDEWIRAIRALSQQPELRRKLGATGRAFVEFEYSVAEGGRRWVALLERLASEMHRRAG